VRLRQTKGIGWDSPVVLVAGGGQVDGDLVGGGVALGVVSPG
jgi:hypothetical protein